MLSHSTATTTPSRDPISTKPAPKPHHSLRHYHTIMERQTRLVLLVLASSIAAGALLAAAAAADLSSAGAHQAMPSSSSLHTLRRVEDDASGFVESLEEAAAFPRRRALYGGGSIGYAALAASKAACYGPCPARGQAYTRGCLAIYQCRG